MVLTSLLVRDSFTSKLLSQFKSLHLSRRSVREFRNEVITTRLFESRQGRFAKRAYFSFHRIRIATVGEHEKRANIRQSVPIKSFDDCGGAHGCVSHQHTLDFHRRNPMPRRSAAILATAHVPPNSVLI